MQILYVNASKKVSKNLKKMIFLQNRSKNVKNIFYLIDNQGDNFIQFIQNF